MLSAALEIAPEDRDDFLARECGADPELRDEVESLLRAAESPDSMLRTRGAAAKLLEEEAGSKTRLQGLRVGRYEILREIGRGGMGTVYLAERADGQYQQRTALKLLPVGANEVALARFTRERQILAQLEHPNIARLIDGGLDSVGQPFLVMEYIEGLPIDQHCQRHSLSLSKRLELLATTCDAVQAAHQQLVVHRDLKPSNIMVDRDGRVKLLDFGIAKLLDPVDPDSERTRTAGRALTPQYASPEQVRGATVSVASDIYQLGLLAYELLTGVRPYELSGSSAAEAEQIICERQPERPSELLSRLAKGDRATLPFRPSQLTGDLDVIVLEALRKEPSRRYRSAEALGSDFRGFLAGRPISARPDTLTYRWGKFVRRHALAVGAVSFVLLLLAGATLAFTWRLAEERDQTLLAAERANAQRLLAEQSRDEAREVVAFLVDLFEGSDPYGDPEPASGWTARELLDRGATHIEERLGERPLLQAELFQTVGTIYRKIGDFATAQDYLDRALSLRRASTDAPALDIAENLVSLGVLYNAFRKREDRGELLLKEASEIFEQHGATTHPSAANALRQLGILADRRGRYEESEALLRRAVPLYEAAYGKDHGMMASVLNNLGSVVHRQGRLAEARDLYQRALEARQGEVGPDHALVATPVFNIAAIHTALGEHARALPLYERALRIWERALGTEHPEVAMALRTLGNCHQQMGDFQKAEERLRQALEVCHGVYGEAHLETAKSLYYLASFESERGRAKDAERLARQAIGIFEQTTSANNPNLAAANAVLGSALIAQQRDAEAEPYLRRSLNSFEAVLGANSVYLAAPLLSLADIASRRGQPNLAEPLYQRALEIRRRAFSPSSKELRQAIDAYAAMLRANGRDAEAERLTRESAPPPS